jgi:glycolate oxidase FAD binding subunit
MSSVTAAPVDEFVASVRGSQPDAVLAEAAARYEVDGMKPAAVIAPHGVSAAADVLTEAQRLAVGVVPAGAGTQLGLGNLPAAYDVALTTQRMDAIVVYEPLDLTVTVQAGLPLARLQAELARHGQHLPLDPPVSDESTVGGVLATNGCGPLRHAHGTSRDWLIGIRMVHADGSITKSGGSVVKNVAGYDMAKLYVGSLGSLGVIVEATFKVAPLPKADVTVLAPFESAGAAAAFVMQVHDVGLSIRAAELLSPAAADAIGGDSRWAVLARVAGSEAAVERSLRDMRAAAGGGVREQDGGWNRWREAFAPRSLAFRAFVMPSEVADVVAALDGRLGGSGAPISATVTAGAVRAQAAATNEDRARTALDAARHAVVARGGTLVVDAAPPALKREIDVFGEQRPDFEIMRRLKHEFDPHRILSRGRYVGRL